MPYTKVCNLEPLQEALSEDQLKDPPKFFAEDLDKITQGRTYDSFKLYYAGYKDGGVITTKCMVLVPYDSTGSTELLAEGEEYAALGCPPWRVPGEEVKPQQPNPGCS